MHASVRIGLRSISILTIGVAAWLVAVIASGRAARGQDLVLLWSIVCAGCFLLAGTTIVATRATPVPFPPSRVAVPALAGLGVAAAAFGLFVLGAELTRAVGGEGYLFGIGLILTVHGLLAIAWAGRRLRQPAR